MFKFLKDKLKGVISSFSRNVEKEAEAKEKLEKPAEGKKSITARITEQITTRRISKEKFHELFWELEVMLLENNVATEIIEKIKQDMESI